MAELSENDKIEIDLISKAAMALLEMDRQAFQTMHHIGDRDDKYTLWIVSLSAGAIAGLSVSPRLAIIPQWQAEVVLAFFVISILSGTIYSYILKEFQVENDLFHYQRQAALIKVLFVLLPRVKSSEEIRQVGNTLQDIQEVREPIIGAQYERTQPWERWRNRIETIPSSMFVGGVIFLAVAAALYWPKPLPTDIVPKQVPQLRQQ